MNTLDAQKVIEVLAYAQSMEHTAKVLTEQM